MSRKYLDRRAVLRGIVGGVGATIGLPLLDAMLNLGGTRLASGQALPMRFGVFFWGNGVRFDHWIPSATGTAWQPKEELQPLAAHRSYTTIVSGTKAYYDYEWAAHHTGRYVALTASYGHEDTYGNCRLPSFDRLVAEAWKGTTPLQSLDVAISRHGFGNSRAGGSISFLGWDGHASIINQPTFSPDTVYNRLFQIIGTATASPTMQPTVDGKKVARTRALDLVLEDANRLRTRLGAADRARLDRHLDSVRAIETRLEQVTTAPTATPPTLVYPNPNVPSNLRSGTPDYLGVEPVNEVGMLMSDLIAYALAVDVTRVFTYQYTGMQVNTIFPGQSEGLHDLSHDGTKQGNVHSTVVYTMQGLSYLLDRLRAYDEPGGTVLDNACIYATSEHGEAYAHTMHDLPILLLGRAGGRLKGNYHFRSTSSMNMTRAPLTALRAIGMNLPSLGMGPSTDTNSIPEILA